MRGESANINSFRTWRERLSQVASVRCTPTSVEDSSAIQCLECVTPGSSSALRSYSPKAHVLKTNSKLIMTFGFLDECQALSQLGNGFCKKDVVALAA